MQIFVGQGAGNDLDNLYLSDEDAAADIEVLLQELESGPEWLWKLSRPEGYRNYTTPCVDSTKFLELWNKGYNLFRLKVYNAPHVRNYRILYACDFHTDTIHILAVVNRDFDYDPHHPIVKRVIADYNGLAFYGHS